MPKRLGTTEIKDTAVETESDVLSALQYKHISYHVRSPWHVEAPLIWRSHHIHRETGTRRVGERPEVTSKVKDEIRLKSESFHPISHSSLWDSRTSCKTLLCLPSKWVSIISKCGNRLSNITGFNCAVWLFGSRNVGITSNIRKYLQRSPQVNYVLCCSQSCLTLCHPRDCSPPGSSVHGDSPGQNTGVGCMPSSRGSSHPRGWTQVSCIAGGFFTFWATREALGGQPLNLQRVPHSLLMSLLQEPQVGNIDRTLHHKTLLPLSDQHLWSLVSLPRLMSGTSLHPHKGARGGR